MRETPVCEDKDKARSSRSDHRSQVSAVAAICFGIWCSFRFLLFGPPLLGPMLCGLHTVRVDQVVRMEQRVINLVLRCVVHLKPHGRWVEDSMQVDVWSCWLQVALGQALHYFRTNNTVQPSSP